MKISHATIEALQKVITGGPIGEQDRAVAPYRSGPDLVNFFNQFGENDVYARGFPSRWAYAEEKIEKYNDTEILRGIIEIAVDPRQFLNSSSSVEKAVDFLNQYLEYDGYHLTKIGKYYKVKNIGAETVKIGSIFSESNQINHQFIQEQLEKCDRKISENDCTGAITNSRTLVEAVLREIETKLDAEAPRYNGDITKLYKRVYRLMNLDPSRPDISNSARMILSGLISVISGLAPLRNKASDAHVPEYLPQKHHAELAVNVSKTIVRFVVDSLEYQLKKGFIKLVE